MAIKIAGTEVINDNKELVLAKLTEINSSIADTAVDIFVYDTRKDSDGGAWRKRTQGTSWYNETLNTATRGSRKEFPAVAVIVAEAQQVTIYDGDDPDLPMWMVFNARGATHADGKTILGWYTSGTPTVAAVLALNGILAVVGATGGAVQIKFIPDSFRIAYSSNSYVSSNNISQRETSSILNVINEGSSGTGGDIVVDYRVNDVAMTVLPNAPIDAATGLPVPTIAVACGSGTSGGVSVIKDDGTVSSHSGTGFSEVAFIEYSSTTYLLASENRFTNDSIRIKSLQNVSGSVGGFNELNGGDAIIAANKTNAAYYNTANNSKDELYVTQLDDPAFVDERLKAYISSSYNTGWMNGDIKLATLSDTDDTDVTGSELVTNGTFDSDLTGWTEIDSGCGSVVSGKARVTVTDNVSDFITQSSAITVEIGKTYTVSVDVTLNSGTAKLYAGYTSTGGQYGVVTCTNGTNSLTFTATTTTLYTPLETVGTTGQYNDFDNVSVRLAEEDRSVNG